MTMNRLRYVVLRHEGIAEPHFDFMLETSPGSMLATFKIARWPIETGDVLQRLADHRRAYLEYEGPLSDNRGHVRRASSGQLEIVSMSEAEWVIRLDTRQTLRLSGAGTTWQVDAS